MLALYRTGRAEAALQSYRSARQALHDEVGLDQARAIFDRALAAMSADGDSRIDLARIDLAEHLLVTSAQFAAAGDARSARRALSVTELSISAPDSLAELTAR